MYSPSHTQQSHPEQITCLFAWTPLYPVSRRWSILKVSFAKQLSNHKNTRKEGRKKRQEKKIREISEEHVCIFWNSGNILTHSNICLIRTSCLRKPSRELYRWFGKCPRGHFPLRMYVAHVLIAVFVKHNLWLCNWTLQSPQAILCLKRSVYSHILPNNHHTT